MWTDCPIWSQKISHKILIWASPVKQSLRWCDNPTIPSWQLPTAAENSCAFSKVEGLQATPACHTQAAACPVSNLDPWYMSLQPLDEWHQAKSPNSHQTLSISRDGALQVRSGCSGYRWELWNRVKEMGLNSKIEPVNPFRLVHSLSRCLKICHNKCLNLPPAE